MSYGTLNLPPALTGVNPQNGRFLKGHVPANKGRKWSQYLSKRKQKRCAKGWANLELHRHRPPNAGRPKKAVIALTDDGEFKYFPYTVAAAKYYNGSRYNVARCCRMNHLGTLDKKGMVNTDHKYKGMRFYYENDTVWIKKIQQ